MSKIYDIPKFISDHRIVSIVAYDNKTHGIGCYPEKELPLRSIHDRKFLEEFIFDDRYMKVCGRNTYNSMPKRYQEKFFIISRSGNGDFNILDEPINYVLARDKKLLICGGQGIYEEAFKNPRVELFIENVFMDIKTEKQFTKFYNRPEEGFRIISKFEALTDDAGLICQIIAERK